MHLPVAPRCNISCNYCNRKFDCTNECRPGVTSKVLTPQEALHKVEAARELMPFINTIGIAGPGDSLANADKTLRTFELINEQFPDMYLCISTNGLLLSEYADDLNRVKAKFVTVTMNALDAETAEKVYRRVFYKGKNYYGREGAEILVEKQKEGLAALRGRGFMVKVNTVLIPGLNEHAIEPLADYVREQGVYMFNVTGLIPVEGSRFAENTAPTQDEIEAARNSVSDRMRIMSHCSQCRSDACGLLGESTSVDSIGLTDSCDGPKEKKACIA
jgi:nitrogen fixation protein NifB